jgi:hypothetical protein
LDYVSYGEASMTKDKNDNNIINKRMRERKEKEENLKKKLEVEKRLLINNGN